MTCTITGVAGLPDGTIFAGASFQFTRMPTRTVGYSGRVVVPVSTTATSDGSGAVSFELVPGTYQVLELGNNIKFIMNVPDASTANFVDCVEAATVVPTPSMVQDVFDARDAAVAAAAAVGFTTRAEFIAWAATATTVAAGSVVPAAGLEYYKSIGATAISDTPNWLPFGDIYVDHFQENTAPGTVDMTTGIQAALDYAASLGGASVRLKASTYKVTATITISANKVSLIGASMFGSVITRSGDYGDTLLVTGSTSTTANVSSNTLSDIEFRSAGLTTSGAHIHLRKAYQATLNNISIYQGFIGIDFESATALAADNIRIVYSDLFGGTDTGRRFAIFRATTLPSAHPSCGDVFVSNFNWRGGPVDIIPVGVEITSADGIWLSNGHIGTVNGDDLLLNASDAANNIGLVQIDNVMLDECAGAGLRMTGNAVAARNIIISNMVSKGGANGTYGLVVDPGATFNHVQISNFCATEWKYDGIRIDSVNANNFTLNAVQARGNSYAVNNTYSGINIAACNGLEIIGGQSGGGNVALTPATQKYGIEIGANAKNVRIVGVDLSRNITGPSLVSTSATNVKFDTDGFGTKANVVKRRRVTDAAWLSSTSAADNDWQSVVWAPELGLFCAVASTGTGNRVMTSPDGIAWTARTSAADNDWRSVTWSPELRLFCAVSTSGTGNRVMTSPDGITWTARTSAADNDWRGVTWSPELRLFCAVASTGGSNSVMTSPDGITWTTRTCVGNQWYGVVWAPELGIFCAVAVTGTGNRVMTSPDGITWTTRTSAADNSWTSLAWSPERRLFCATSNTGTGNRVMTSPDGITWTTRTSAADNDWRGVTWSPELGLFCAVSTSGTGNRVMTSPDGITWTTRTSAADISLLGVAWSPELCMFCSVAATGTGNRVMTSVSGNTVTYRS